MPTCAGTASLLGLDKKTSAEELRHHIVAEKSLSEQVSETYTKWRPLFNADEVARDRIIFSEVYVAFPSLFLEELPKLVAEYNARIASVRGAADGLGCNIKTLIELYAAKVNNERKNHRQLKTMYSSTFRRAVERRVLDKELTEEQLMHVGHQLRVKDPEKVLDVLDTYIARATETLWVEN